MLVSILLRSRPVEDGGTAVIHRLVSSGNSQRPRALKIMIDVSLTMVPVDDVTDMDLKALDCSH